MVVMWTRQVQCKYVTVYRKIGHNADA